MKVIKVDCCGNCPRKSFYIERNEVKYRCYDLSVEGTVLTKMDIVHPDCPLEDYEKGE